MIKNNYFQTVKSKTETVTEEMLDEDLKEDELSDSEEPPAVVDVEQEETQPSNISNKFVLYLQHFFYGIRKQMRRRKRAI